MIEIVKIVEHGNHAEILELKDEILECPECGTVSTYPFSGEFRLIYAGVETFEFGCHSCACRFELKVKRQ